MSKDCFFITPIGDVHSSERLRANEILKILKNALKKFGFNAQNVFAAHNISSPGIITKQIVQQLVKSSLVVADLSGLNSNVMYELALRHFTYLPVIQICDDTTTLPFDVENMRTIIYHYDKKISTNFQPELVKAYEAIVKDSLSVNPMNDLLHIDLFKDLTGISGIKRLPSLNDMFIQMTLKMKSAKKSIDDITWATTTYYRTKSDKDAYDEYKAAMQEVLNKKNVKYREISNIAHQTYLWRIENMIGYYNYSIGYYELPKIPLISYMIIDDKDAFIGFYRDPYLPIDNEVYLHITNNDILALLIDYYQTLWTASSKIKEGDTVDSKILDAIKGKFIK